MKPAPTVVVHNFLKGVIITLPNGLVKYKSPWNDGRVADALQEVIPNLKNYQVAHVRTESFGRILAAQPKPEMVSAEPMLVGTTSDRLSLVEEIRSIHSKIDALLAIWDIKGA